jgi:hypothetical protein
MWVGKKTTTEKHGTEKHGTDAKITLKSHGIDANTFVEGCNEPSYNEVTYLCIPCMLSL